MKQENTSSTPLVEPHAGDTAASCAGTAAASTGTGAAAPGGGAAGAGGLRCRKPTSKRADADQQAQEQKAAAQHRQAAQVAKKRRREEEAEAAAAAAGREAGAYLIGGTFQPGDPGAAGRRSLPAPAPAPAPPRRGRGARPPLACCDVEQPPWQTLPYFQLICRRLAGLLLIPSPNGKLDPAEGSCIELAEVTFKGVQRRPGRQTEERPGVCARRHLPPPAPPGPRTNAGCLSSFDPAGDEPGYPTHMGELPEGYIAVEITKVLADASTLPRGGGRAPAAAALLKFLKPLYIVR